jgi:hypothetical protein
MDLYASERFFPRSLRISLKSDKMGKVNQTLSSGLKHCFQEGFRKFPHHRLSAFQKRHAAGRDVARLKIASPPQHVIFLLSAFLLFV